MFVDDEEAVAEIGQKFLEYLGYEVVGRTSSLEALELFWAKADQFDLVITDMTMPNMTGERLAREILAIRPGIPNILCTGFSEYMSEEKAKALGIRELVMKPQEPQSGISSQALPPLRYLSLVHPRLEAQTSCILSRVQSSHSV